MGAIVRIIEYNEDMRLFIAKSEKNVTWNISGNTKGVEWETYYE